MGVPGPLRAMAGGGGGVFPEGWGGGAPPPFRIHSPLPRRPPESHLDSGEGGKRPERFRERCFPHPRAIPLSPDIHPRLSWISPEGRRDLERWGERSSPHLSEKLSPPPAGVPRTRAQEDGGGAPRFRSGCFARAKGGGAKRV